MSDKIQVKIVRKYGLWTGARFAVVEVNYRRLDVRVRGDKLARIPNAWGDDYPVEETGVKVIKAEAVKQAVKQAVAQGWLDG